MDTPNRKVMAGGLAGALTIILIWAVQSFSTVVVPGEVGSAITAVLSFIVSYFTKEPA